VPSPGVLNARGAPRRGRGLQKRPIFTDAIGDDDTEHMRRTLFASGNLTQPYHSINTDVQKRIRYLEGGED